MSGTITINLVPPLQSVAPALVHRGIGPFAGLPRAQLEAALAAAQQALIACLTGRAPVSVSYAEGPGHRQVTYNRANSNDLRALINDLKAALGLRTRGAIVPRFG